MALSLGLSLPAGKWGYHLCTAHGGEMLVGDHEFAEAMPGSQSCPSKGVDMRAVSRHHQ